MSDNTRNRVQQDPLFADGSDQFISARSSVLSFPISPATHSHNLISSNILRLGSLNVRSLVSPTKQLNLFSILLSRALHGIILTETNLCSPAHRYICNPYLTSYHYHSWFTYSPIANRHSGVGIILHSSLAMYVVKKKFYSDRLIGLTLQLPGKRNILLIGGYIPPVSSSNHSIIADCYSTLISWIRLAHSSDHSVLLGGDLNADLESFLKQLTATHPGSSPLNPLFKFLHEQRFDDLCELDNLSLVPSPTFRSSSSGSLSRLDYIWISLFFPIPHLWSSVSDLTDVISTDHFLIIAHFDFLELRDHHAPRQRCRTNYDFHSATPAQKESFTSAVSSMLPDVSVISCTRSLNQLWHQFKSALLSASRSHFPRINVSLSRPKAISHELQPYTRLNNSLTHFMISLRKLVTISQLQLAWSRFFVDFKPAFLSLFPDQLCLLNNLPDPLNLDDIFTKFKTTSMKSAVAERNKNFYENKGKFISSSLNRERRCIVLDRVLVVNLPDSPKLLVAPEEIKAAAITHFQNVVGPSVSPFDSFTSLPLRWQK
ncbi:DNase I-like protein [Rhizophagus irregularis]|uniref:DNase I-like protein n=1 Tax=Rhizophagus irregularis TaxID=588596 RepID=A0A2I1GT16_9GLOM|nr:DNase I-like protein [Rhizophagus irregularis]